MHFWRKLINYKSVSWVVLAAVIVLSLLPMHIHMHHDESVFSESHITDETVGHHDEHASSIHAVSNVAGHDGHEEVTSIAATPDTLIKVNINPLFLAVLVGVFVFLSIVILPQKLRPLRSLHFRKFYIGITPPLRAPPLL